jgi:hypothetical protein
MGRGIALAPAERLMFAQSSNEAQKRREDACALRKLRGMGKCFLVNFARSAFGVRGVLAPLSFVLMSLSCARG